MFTDDMTPLQRAQAFSQAWADIRANLVGRLRAQGWSREDAEEAADQQEARELRRREKRAGYDPL